jgi:hypothetical protein
MTGEKPTWPDVFDHHRQTPSREFVPTRGDAAVLYKFWHKAAISRMLRWYVYGQADNDFSAEREAESIEPRLPKEVALAAAAEAVAELWWEWAKEPFSVAALKALPDPVDPPHGDFNPEDRDPRPFFKGLRPEVLAAAEEISEAIGWKYERR